MVLPVSEWFFTTKTESVQRHVKMRNPEKYPHLCIDKVTTSCADPRHAKDRQRPPKSSKELPADVQSLHGLVRELAEENDLLRLKIRALEMARVRTARAQEDPNQMPFEIVSTEANSSHAWERTSAARPKATSSSAPPDGSGPSTSCSTKRRANIATSKSTT
jgi:hypothetical protein